MRIMTSNIWGDYFGNPTRGRDDKLWGIYRKYAPDVLGFQEVTGGWYESSLFEKLSGDYYFVGTELYDFKNYVPMAIKKEIQLLAKGFEYLTDTPDSSKAITWAVLHNEADGKLFGVCNTHFWWMGGKEEHDEAAALSPLSQQPHQRVGHAGAEAAAEADQRDPKLFFHRKHPLHFLFQYSTGKIASQTQPIAPGKKR